MACPCRHDSPIANRKFSCFWRKTNKEIVAILNVSVRTIETYRARLMLKGNLHSVPHLVRCAFRNNVI